MSKEVTMGIVGPLMFLMILFIWYMFINPPEDD